MSKRIRIDYYTVKLPNNPGISFIEPLKQFLKAKRTLIQRNIKAHDHYIRMQNLEFSKDIVKEGVYIGTLLRIRMNDLPLKVGLENGDVDFLPLKDEEGLGEQTFFLYAPSVNILLFHNGRDGVKASGFAYYFERIIPDIETIELEPVIEKDVIEKLVS